MTVSLGVTGATGRMGRNVLAQARDRDDISVAFAVSRSGTGDEVEGVPVASSDEFADLLAANDPDAVVDFTAPEMSQRYAELCADAGVPVVVGTTGFDDEDILRDASDRTPVLKAANFAPGVQAFIGAVEAAVERLPEYDIELTETHHNRKLDAPSGTANAVLDHVADVRESAGERVHGRVGDAPRDADEIGVHSRRAGTLHGEHEILLAGNDEALTLTHRAESRGVFAAGALDAAVWLAEREPGWYDFTEVLGGNHE